MDNSRQFTLKPWGYSITIYRDDDIEIVAIHVEPGGYCSLHRHDNKTNEFCVISGELEVVSSPGDEVLVTVDNVIEVPARKLHLFRSPAGCDAVEVYRRLLGGPPVDPHDIVRIIPGGRDFTS